MRIVLIGPFGLRPKMTMAHRALPLARALAARGHAVRVVLPPWDCPEESGHAWRADGVEVVNVRLPPMLPLLGHLWLTVRLLRSALSFRPEVIHCFKPKAYSGLAAAVLWMMQRLRLWQGRLVVDADDWEGPGGWNEVADYSWAQRAFFAWQERWGLRHCDAVTVASRWLEQRVGEMRGGRGGVWYVPNGVEQGARSKMQEARGKRQGAGSKRTVLLYTRFVEFEGERVVGIWRRVVEAVPEARLLVVGEGFRGEERELARRAAQAGLGDSVDIIGWVEEAGLPQFFAAADVAIMPVDDTILSRAKCPVRLLDLMAAGVPVVAEAVGEYAELVEDGVSGLLVPSGDEAAFAAAVVRLLEDERLRREMGQAARSRVHTAFCWERLVERVEKAYAGAALAVAHQREE